MSNDYSSINKIFSFLFSIQAVMLFLFLIDNFSDLDVIVFDFSEADYDAINFEVSFYDLLLVLGALFLVAVVSGLNILGTGLNEESTKTFQKFCAFVSIYIIMLVGINYYMIQLVPFNLYIDLFITIIYVVKAFTDLGGNKE